MVGLQPMYSAQQAVMPHEITVRKGRDKTNRVLKCLIL